MLEVIKQLSLGDHAALFYRSRQEQLAVAIPYILIGLERNERCLYIADDNSVPLVLNRLEDAGVDLDDAGKRNALRVTTKKDTYLRYGLFEPDNMVRDLREEVELSLRNGFNGFRATGEMTWALDLPSALARLLEYEAKLHAQFPTEFLGLCQYDETRFPETIVTGMAHLHPVLIRDSQLSRQPFPTTAKALLAH